MKPSANQPQPAIPETPSLLPGIITHSGGRRDDYVTASAKVHPDTPDRSDDLALLAQAQEDFRTCLTWENDWRRKAEKEIDFVDHLDHWDASTLAERQGRPCLKFNLIGPAVDQVVNNARQNPPEALISPVGGGADKWTAEVIEGLFRNIANDSEETIADLTAYEHAVKVGRGWCRIYFDYESDATFEQKIVVGRIPNLFSIYPDPAADKFDYSDMRFLFATEDMDADTARELYPGITVPGMDQFSGTGDQIQAQWYPQGNIRIAEYWWIENREAELFLLPNGRVVPKDQVFGADIVATRKTFVRKVHFAKLTGLDVIERKSWPGKYIPFVPLLGRESIKRGRRTLRGMIQDALDPNLAYDYARSKEAEAISLAPISQWLIAHGQIEGFENLWADANRKPFAYLPYHHVIGDDNQPVPPPIRVQAQNALPAITEAIAHAANDAKQGTSTYDANLGAKGPEQSGIAIEERKQQGDNAHFNYLDNYRRYERHKARIKLDLIPYVYNEARAITIYDPDGASRDVLINQATVHQGIQRIFNLSDPAARYHVTIGTGPTFASQKLQRNANLIEVSRTMPIINEKAPDLIAKALDLGDDLIERLRPPGIKTDLEEQYGPEAARILSQQSQLISMLQQQLEIASSKMTLERVKLASAERIAAGHDAAGITDSLIKANSAETVKQLEQEMATIRTRMQVLNSNPQTENPGPDAPAAGPASAAGSPMPAAAQPGASPQPAGG